MSENLVGVLSFWWPSGHVDGLQGPMNKRAIQTVIYSGPFSVGATALQVALDMECVRPVLTICACQASYRRGWGSRVVPAGSDT
jgi:hypothetical protein